MTTTPAPRPRQNGLGRRTTLLAASLAAVGVSSASAASFTLEASDASTTSSFTNPLTAAAAGWTDGTLIDHAPSAGNTYATGAFILRTPTTGDHSFAGDSLTVQTGGQLAIKGPAASTITVNNLILDGGNLNVASGTAAATFNVAGNITVDTTGSVKAFSSTGSNTQVLNLQATLAGSGTLNVPNDTTNNSRGTVRLGAANTFNGTINVTANPVNATSGALQLGHLDAAKFATINVSSTHATNPGLTFSAGVGTYNVGALSGTVSTGRVLTASGIKLSVGANNTSTSFAGTIAGAGSLVKVGAGTLALTGANTYTGGTTVDSGAISFGSAFTMSGANGVSVNAGGASGGFIANDVVTNYGGTLAINFTGAASGLQVYDLFSTAGAGSFGGAFTGMSIAGTYTGALAVTAGGFAATIDGVSFSFDHGTGDLTVSAIPEPASFAVLLGLASVGAAATRRRRA